VAKQSQAKVGVLVIEWFKWLSALLIVALGFFGNHQFQDQPFLLKLLIGIVLFVFVLIILFKTKSGQTFWQFARESRLEMQRVVWPTKPETIQSTIGVLAMVVLMGLVLWAVDSILLRVVAMITGYGA
jgi:preprotein translocase subunit SecE